MKETFEVNVETGSILVLKQQHHIQMLIQNDDCVMYISCVTGIFFE